MSGPRMGMSQMNGTGRRPMNITRTHSNPMPTSLPVMSIEKPVCSQHDDLIRYIHDSWSKVEMDRVRYHQEQDSHHLKDFKAFDLEGYWGCRIVAQESQHNS